MNHAIIIDDDEDYRNLLLRKLIRSYPDIQITEIDPLATDLPGHEYQWEQVDFIILDYQLGIDITGLDWFKRFNPEEMPATILLTAKGTEELAVRAIKLGIDDYIVKEQFSNDTLSNAIDDCVYQKKLNKAKFSDLRKQSEVFKKPNFIRKLASSIRETSMVSHLMVFNPAAYQQVGKEKGLSSQDSYINHVAKKIYRYISSSQIDCNIYIYKEEYIAVIVESKTFKRHLNKLYKMLDEEHFILEDNAYSCSVSIGVISPQGLEERELEKSDFELLSVAHNLCDSAKCNKTKRICSYGDINLSNEIMSSGSTIESGPVNLKKAINDGRVSANYQPWVNIASDESTAVKDIYDIRIDVIDPDGDRISQAKLIDLLDNAFARRVADRWTLRHSITKLAEMALETGKQSNIKFVVKLTLSTVSDTKFTPWLKDLLNDAPPMGSLLLEIESSQFMRNPGQYKNLIKGVGKFFDIKFVLSGIYQIDTYYRVRNFQKFDFIKLNVKDLIYGFPRDPLNDLINTVKSDGGKIVAINVADAETLNMATTFKIDYVHGYLVGRPFTDIVTDREGDLHCVV